MSPTGCNKLDPYKLSIGSNGTIWPIELQNMKDSKITGKVTADE
jgi:hypothetical protein